MSKKILAVILASFLSTVSACGSELKAVTEYTYPIEYKVAYNPNAPKGSAGYTIVPTKFATRETGVKLNVEAIVREHNIAEASPSLKINTAQLAKIVHGENIMVSGIIHRPVGYIHGNYYLLNTETGRIYKALKNS